MPIFFIKDYLQERCLVSKVEILEETTHCVSVIKLAKEVLTFEHPIVRQVAHSHYPGLEVYDPLSLKSHTGLAVRHLFMAVLHTVIEMPTVSKRTKLV